MQCHRHQEFIRFLSRIEREVPAHKAIHVILDNYAAHKKDKVRAWLDRHPRWTFHFTPTSCSWLNAVEGFFAKLTRRRLKHGVFHSVVDLQAAINRFVREYNDANPKPFIWKADPDEIIAARNQGFQTLESIHQHIKKFLASGEPSTFVLLFSILQYSSIDKLVLRFVFGDARRMAFDEKTYRRLRNANCADAIAFVQGCLKRYFATTSDVATAEFAAPDISLRNVFEISTLNKIAIFLLKVLPQVRMGEGSAELMRSLDAYHRNTILLNSSSLLESLAIQTSLRKVHIDFVFLKGPIQQSLLYGDYFMKLSGDVHVLVSPANFPKAREALRSIGYEVTSKSSSVWAVRFLGEQHMTRVMPRYSTVDLYHRLPQPGSPSPRNLDGFLKSKRSVEVVGGQVPFISGTNVLLLSCISVANAIFNREPCAGYVCDVRASVNGMSEADQRLLIDYAEEQGLVGTLLLGVRAANLLLGEAGGPLSERARRIPIPIDDQDLRNMVIAPWLSTKRWPQRRTVLWELCDRILVRGTAASAELSRRTFERPSNG